MYFADGMTEALIGDLADARVWLGIVGSDRGELPRARYAARKALELDDRVGQAYAVLGLVRLFHDWDFVGARRAYERALRLSPSDPTALNAYGMYQMWVGRTEGLLEVTDRLLRVAPLDRSRVL